MQFERSLNKSNNNNTVKFIFFFDTSTTNSFLCCFSLESGIKLLCWLGVIFNLINLLDQNNNVWTMINTIKLIIFSFLLVGLVFNKKNQFIIGYNLFCIKFYCNIIIILIMVCILSDYFNIMNKDMIKKGFITKYDQYLTLKFSENFLIFFFLYYSLFVILLDLYIIYILYSYIKQILNSEQNSLDNNDDKEIGNNNEFEEKRNLLDNTNCSIKESDNMLINNVVNESKIIYNNVKFYDNERDYNINKTL